MDTVFQVAGISVLAFAWLLHGTRGARLERERLR